MAHALGLTVVAEGVETASRSSTCAPRLRLAQGYL